MDNDDARLNDIVAALQSTLVIPAGTPPNTPTGQGISKANGYTYDLPAENVYLPAQQDILNSKDPAVYPKIIFAVDGGNFALGASRRNTRTVRLSVTIIIQEKNLDVLAIADKPQGWRPVGKESTDLKDDIEKSILKNLTLGRTVDRCVPSDFELDSNFAYPDGVIVVWFDVLYYND